MAQNIPVSLAWWKITHNKLRLLVSTIGISFAVVLIFANVGFLHAMYDSQIELLSFLNADLILTSNPRYAMFIPETFPRRRVEQAKAVAGVQAAYAVYVDIATALWTNPDDSTRRSIRVVAFNPDDPVLLMPEVQANVSLLKEPDTVLLDVNSRPSYGRREVGLTREISDHSVRVAAIFHLGPDFLSDGNVIMSDQTYLKCCAPQGAASWFLSKAHLGLIKLSPNVDPRSVTTALRLALPGDVKVQTKQEFIDQEMAFWKEKSPIGFVFGLGAALGSIVGVIICYQILYTDVVDDLPQFATMKSLGYRDSTLVAAVLFEAVLLALAGFLPGFLLSTFLFRVIADFTQLPMRLSEGRVAVVFVLSLVMCVAAGLIAVRKVIRADPAEVF